MFPEDSDHSIWDKFDGGQARAEAWRVAENVLEMSEASQSNWQIVRRDIEKEGKGRTKVVPGIIGKMNSTSATICDIPSFLFESLGNDRNSSSIQKGRLI